MNVPGICSSDVSSRPSEAFFDIAFCYVVIEALMPAANVFVFAFVYGYGYFANPIAITRG